MNLKEVSEMKCKKCHELESQGENGLCWICERDILCDYSETAAILERLEEALKRDPYMTNCPNSEKACVCPLDSPYSCVNCNYCWAFYIKHGRMITEKDLDNA
jgi:hypothetical protein